MPTQVQFRRGTTGQNNTFTGAEGELTIDTTTWGIRVHDGTTAGGHSLSAGNSNNISGGAAGAIPYQIATSSTGFISIGAADTVLVSNGSTATWVDLGTLTGTGGVNADNLLVNSITSGDRYLVVTDSTGAYTALEASTATLYNDSTGLTLNKTFNAGGDIVPTTNGTYNLGSSGNRFAALYITSSSLYIGATHVTGTGTTGLSVNGIPVALTTENNDLSGRNLTLTGNLIVQGTTVTVDSTVTNVSDPIFTLGTGPSGAAPASDDNKDRGIAFRWHNGSSAKTGFFGFDDSTGYFTFVPDGTITGEVVSGSTGDFQANNFRGNLIGNVTGDLTGVSSTATNLAGGAAGSIPYQTAAGVTNFVGIGSNGLILTSNGTAPTWTALSGLSAGSATTATNVAGGSAGSLVIQNGNGSTSFVSPGSAGQFLQAGTNTATFVSTSSMYVNSAVNAEKIFGGTAGQLVYQSGVGTTAFAGPGTAGQLLMSAGTGAPTYTNTSSIYVNSSVNAEKWATARTITLGGDLSGSMVLDGSQNVTLTATVAIDTIALGTDTTGIYVAQGATSGFGLSGSASTEGSTFTVTANSTSANTVSTIVYRDSSGNFSAGTITATAFSGPITGTATTATNISGGTAGQLAIQSGAGTTAFVPVGTSGQFLQAGTNTATFVSTSSMYVNSAVNAEKWLTARTFTFGGDLTGSMVVNGSQDVTFTATIAANSVALGTDTTGDYVSNGATSGFGLSGSTTGESQTFTVTANSTSANTVSTIVYRDASGNFSAGTITASLTGTATTSTNVAGGAAGQLHIQSGAGTTAFVPVGTSGQFLQAGTTTATFVSTSSMYVNSAVNAEKWITARTFTFGGDLSGSMVVDGSQNVTFTATIAANSVALGTDTTGDYVSNGATSGFGLSGSTTGETQTFTVTANSTSSNTANTIMYRDANGDFAAGGATFSRPVTFSEPVTFSGTATFVYSTNTVYTDNILNIHTPPGGGPTNHVWGTDDGKDIGFIFHYYKSATDRDAFLGFNNSSQFLEWFSNGSEGGGVYTGTTYGTFRTGSIRLQDLTAVNSTNSGALQVAGGVGINGGLFVGGVVTATSFSGSFSGTVTGTASTATNLAGGAAGQIPIQSAAGTTAFIPVGTAGQFLQAGTNTATFVSTSSMYVNSAVNAEKIFGGTAGQLVYQSGVGTTSFAGPGTAGQLLMSAGTSAPTYTNTSSIYVNNSVNAEKWLTARTFTFGGDLSGSMVVNGSQDVTFTATIAANSVALGTDTTGDYVSNGATSGFGLSGSTTGETQTFTVTANSTSANTVSTIVYRDASGNFSAGTITASLTGTATTATNVAGGAAGQLHIQSGAGTTAFVPVGTAGQFLQAGTNTATFVSTSSMYVNNAVVADQLKTVGLHNSAVYFVPFVDTNNVSSTAELFYTTSTVSLNPVTGVLTATSFSGSTANITAATSATTTQTGALIVTGGLGVGNNIVAGGALFVGTPTGTVGAVGEIRATNEITAYYSSDQHLKENIQLISDPIEKLNQIRGVYFDWKDSFIDYRGGEDGYFVRKHDVGVIAQEVAKVLPEVVAHKSDGYMGVKYEKMIPLLIEAIKDQQRQITQLSEQVNKLVNK